MNKEEMVGLAVRLFAVYLAITTLANLGSLIAFSKMGATQEVSFGFLAPAVGIPVGVAISLWLWPLSVARKLLPENKDETPEESHATLAEYQAVAFSVLGMWLLVEYLPTLFYWFGYAFYLNGHPGESFTAKDYGKAISTVFGLVIGLWLLFGARGIVGLVRYARSAGTN